MKKRINQLFSVLLILFILTISSALLSCAGKQLEYERPAKPERCKSTSARESEYEEIITLAEEDPDAYQEFLDFALTSERTD